MTLISFLFFTIAVAAITYALTRKDDHGTSAGYFLGGRQLGGIVIAGSLLLTNLSTEQMVGLNGDAFKDGLAVMVWEVVAVLALICMALFFLPRFLKSGIATVPQFLESRYDAGTRTFTDIIFLAAYAVILLPIVLYTGATALVDIISVKELIGLETDQETLSLLGAEVNADTFVLWLTVWVVGIVGACYALFGGLRSVAVSDTLNGVGLLVGGLLVTVFGLAAISHTLGDGSGGVLDGWSTMKANGVENKTFNSIGNKDTSVPFSTVFTGIALLNLFYWCTNQQIIQRTFGAKSLKEGQKGVLICALLKLLGPLYLVLPGIMAFVLYSNDIGFKSNKAYGTLVGDVLPPYLAGFFAAVLVGAILSSFNSALNATCTLFSLGIYKNFINKGAEEKQTVRSGKTVGWIVAVIAMILAPLLAKTTSIFGYLQTMNAIYFIPILAVVVVGMLTKRVPGKAANLALVVGIVALMAGYWVPIGEHTKESDPYPVPIAQKAEEIANAADDPAVSVTFIEEVTVERIQVKTAFNDEPEATEPQLITYAMFVKTETKAKTFAPDIMHQFHFMGLVFGSLIILMLVIGRISPRSEPWVHEHSGDVELTPWKGAKVMAVVLVVLVIAIYASFANFAA